MNLKIKLSAAVAAAIFIGCGGSNSTVDNDDSMNTPKLKTITGKAIDGYVANANIFYCGSDTNLTTNASGNFNITNIDLSTCSKPTLDISGGTDLSTGEAFEGTLSVALYSDKISNIVATPLTTLISSLVDNGKSEADAKSAVATSLGFETNTTILDTDIISVANNGTPAEKLNAANAIKAGLVVQKLSEAFASAVPTDNDKVQKAVMGAVAEMIGEGKTLVEVIDDIDTVASKAEVHYNSLTRDLDTNRAAQVAASANSAKALANKINSMNASNMVAEGKNANDEIKKSSKAIEVLSSVLEKKLAKTIAKATNADEIAAAKTSVDTEMVSFFDSVDMDSLVASIDPAADASDMADGVDGGASLTDAVNTANSAIPEIKASTISGQTATVSTSFNLDISSYFTAPEGEVLSFTATGLPVGLTMNTNGKITGTPTTATASTVTVTATDSNNLTASTTFIITVVAAEVPNTPSVTPVTPDNNTTNDVIVNTNNAPTLSTPISDTNGTVGEVFTTLDISGNFTDADADDTLTFTATGLPAGLTISNTGIISGTPTAAATSTVIVTAKDNSDANVSDEFIITVAKAPIDPNVTISGAGTTTADDAIAEIYTISAATTYSHTIVDFDPTADKLNFGTSVTADGISIINTKDDGNATFSYTPDAGNTVVDITLTNLTSEQDKALTDSYGLNLILK